MTLKSVSPWLRPRLHALWTLPRAASQNPGSWTPSDKPPQPLGLGWVASLLALAAWAFARWREPALSALGLAAAPSGPPSLARIAALAALGLAAIAACAALAAIPEAATLCRKKAGGEGVALGWARGVGAWLRAWLSAGLVAAALGAALVAGAWQRAWILGARRSRGRVARACRAMASGANAALDALFEAAMAAEAIWEPTRVDFLLRQGLGAQWLGWKRQARGPGIAPREDRASKGAPALIGREPASWLFDWPLKADHNPFWAPKGWMPLPPVANPIEKPNAQPFYHERSVFFAEDCLRSKVQPTFQKERLERFRAVCARLALLAEKIELQGAAAAGAQAGRKMSAEKDSLPQAKIQAGGREGKDAAALASPGEQALPAQRKARRL